MGDYVVGDWRGECEEVGGGDSMKAFVYRRRDVGKIG